jgi:hypothetical protein
MVTVCARMPSQDYEIRRDGQSSQIVALFARKHFTIGRNPWKTAVAGAENRVHERVETDFDQVKHPGQGADAGCRSSGDAERWSDQQHKGGFNRIRFG